MSTPRVRIKLRRRPSADSRPRPSNEGIVKGYNVGYGKPPTRTQFKKGQSGNPKGRPKHSRNFKTMISDVLTAPISIREGEKQRKVTKLEGIALQLAMRALKGDNGAAQTLLKYAAQAGLVSPTEAVPDEPQLSAAEQEILDDIKIRLEPNRPKRK
jgi:hypothetical protein